MRRVTSCSDERPVLEMKTLSCQWIKDIHENKNQIRKLDSKFNLKF